MFPTVCSTTAFLRDHSSVGGRHTMPARSPSVGGIPSKTIGLPGIMFVTLGVSPAGHLGPNPCHPSPKVTNIFVDQISTPLLWKSGLLSLINLFLSHLLTPKTRTMPPCRQHHSIPLIAKILLMPQDGWVMVESSDKMWFTGEWNGKPPQYSCLENPMISMKRQKYRTLKDELPKLVGAQYATEEEWRTNSRKNDEIEPKWKQCTSCRCDW